MDALQGVGNPELRATLLWARNQTSPVTADELAQAHGLHRNVARSRLERLTAAGLLRTTFERRSGRRGPGAGRPAKLYAVAPQLETIEFPRRRYETLVGLLLDALQAGTRPASIGAAFGRQLAEAAGLRPARGLRSGVERICTALRALGYQASVAEVAADRAVIATPTCPLRPLVLTHPEAAELDQGMWLGLLRVALPQLETVVACTECHDGNASCRITVATRP